MLKILRDEDLDSFALMPIALDALETAFLAKASANIVCPPRHHVSFPGSGDLVFTVGGILGEKPLAGFRVYETFNGPEHSQIVAVWSVHDAKLKGIILGERLGQIRTGAIGGVAIRHLSDPNAKTVGVIGSSAQARMQLIAAAAVRNIKSVRVFSRDEKNCRAFAEEMQRELDIAIEPAGSIAETVADADIVLCATDSNVPVLHAADLKAGAHVNTVGPKTLRGHELGLDVADAAHVIVTDSIEQTRTYASPFFLAGSAHETRMRDLADIVANKVPGRTLPSDTTLFCSVGLAGTEVAVASAIFDVL
ncbi:MULTISPECIES: ornithine cyclodeaminase family protein [Rhizobium]|jgi:ornithine cyclodeaminase|uniref:Ornithine cyclodeaminase family protein n=1 Tax=Rhizobium tropici TaxID=398 RepID=A0A329Y3K8_RHITR|nr:MULTISPECIES: ornithine cyclodeaminase family protein [Rhizobium]MDK4719261.1 ornithine cyclodeaminase family protein [Rhizobium sp. CNPSo 3968]RAX38276.1 ornithine cyclodeaminase family protein [Rhizobium tropici]